jgi:hypothetical protein
MKSNVHDKDPLRIHPSSEPNATIAYARAETQTPAESGTQVSTAHVPEADEDSQSIKHLKQQFEHVTYLLNQVLRSRHPSMDTTQPTHHSLSNRANGPCPKASGDEVETHTGNNDGNTMAKQNIAMCDNAGSKLVSIHATPLHRAKQSGHCREGSDVSTADSSSERYNMTEYLAKRELSTMKKLAVDNLEYIERRMEHVQDAAQTLKDHGKDKCFCSSSLRIS